MRSPTSLAQHTQRVLERLARAEVGRHDSDRAVGLLAVDADDAVVGRERRANRLPEIARGSRDQHNRLVVRWPACADRVRLRAIAYLLARRSKNGANRVLTDSHTSSPAAMRFSKPSEGSAVPLESSEAIDRGHPRGARHALRGNDDGFSFHADHGLGKIIKHVVRFRVFESASLDLARRRIDFSRHESLGVDQ